MIPKGDLNRIKQSMKRHKQQGDQGSLHRRSNIVELQKALDDTTSEIGRHRAEAAAAIAAYIIFVTAAPDIHKNVSDHLASFLKLVDRTTPEDINAMTTAAST